MNPEEVSWILEFQVGTGCLQPVSRSDKSNCRFTTITSCGCAAQVASNLCHPRRVKSFASAIHRTGCCGFSSR
jgi:hypothetical protein